MQHVVSDTVFSLIDSIGKGSIIHQGVEILVENGGYLQAYSWGCAAASRGSRKPRDM